MSMVLGSAVTLSWCFEDERIDNTDALLDHVGLEPGQFEAAGAGTGAGTWAGTGTEAGAA
jgi:hypothetical protein